MIDRAPGRIRIAHDDGSWHADHDDSCFGGPASLAVGGDELLRGRPFYIDDLTAESAVLTKNRASRKGGAAVHLSEGYFPFGAEVRFSQTVRYAANHARITFDLIWPSRARIRRRIGIGSLFLPGTWTRYYCVPPVTHLLEGAEPAWHAVPAEAPGSGMIGHWHRAPLALVFERADGTRLEIGTGDDTWRWDTALGFGPEAGSFKILVEDGGLSLVREPLMTCEEVEPLRRPYRLNWYLAWQAGTSVAPRLPGEVFPLDVESNGSVLPAELADNPNAALLFDMNRMPLADSGRRVPDVTALALGEYGAAPCWQSNPARKAARKIVRKLAGTVPPESTLVFRGIDPGICVDPGHWEKTARNGLPHGDAAGILDFAVWTRQKLGPEYSILCDTESELPSMRGLFGPNGFGVQPDDDE